MDNQIKNRFLSLKLTGQRSALSSTEKKEHDLQTIQYLQSVLDKREVTSFEDVGFCYWNISDNFAFLRDGHAEFENHNKFYAHIKTEHTRYLYWAVNDATQRLTLEKDGYTDFWWGIYREACSGQAKL